jgi:hypothetical protein
MAPKPPKPVTKFSLAAYMFGLQEAGSIREPILGLYIGDGTLSRYCAWFSNFKVHAIDWAVMHNTQDKYSVFSGLAGNVPFTNYTVQDPITIDALVPNDNRTQIGIAQQRKASFLVRFIISYNNDKNRRTFMVEYPGVAPSDLFGKIFWGSLQVLGDTPYSVNFLFPRKLRIPGHRASVAIDDKGPLSVSGQDQRAVKFNSRRCNVVSHVVSSVPDRSPQRGHCQYPIACQKTLSVCGLPAPSNTHT